MSVLRLAVGLTIWYGAAAVLMIVLMVRPPMAEQFVLVPVFIAVTYYLLPVRWALVLTLLIRTARAKPLPFLPRSLLVQVPVLVVIQLVLGFLSFAGVWALLSDNVKVGDHVFGFTVHVVVPSLMVAWLARRARKIGTTAASSAGSTRPEPLKPSS